MRKLFLSKKKSKSLKLDLSPITGVKPADPKAAAPVKKVDDKAKAPVVPAKIDVKK